MQFEDDDAEKSQKPLQREEQVKNNKDKNFTKDKTAV